MVMSVSVAEPYPKKTPGVHKLTLRYVVLRYYPLHTRYLDKYQCGCQILVSIFVLIFSPICTFVIAHTIDQVTHPKVSNVFT